VNLDGHVSIVGTTSSGKSTLAKKLAHMSRRLCVCINAQAEDGWPGREVRDAPTVADLVRGGKVTWTPRDVADLQAQLPGLVGRLWAFGERLDPGGAENRAAPRINLFFDEAQLYAPKGGPPGPVERVYTQGLRYGVVGVAITQRPQLLSHTVLSQSRTVALYRATGPDREYLDRTLAPIPEADWQFIQRPYHWLRLEAGVWTRQEPV
jgi:hypothetical protein